jgi:DNA polymerase III sliding clamp (beta) subunit (PCNA family)
MEAEILADKEGFHIEYTDGVEFIWIIIPASEFVKYELEQDKLIFQIKTKDLSKVINKFKDENLNLEITESLIKVKVEKDNKTKNYEMRLLDRDREKSDMIEKCKAVIKKDEFSTTVKIKSKELQELFDDLALDIDNIIIEVIGGKLFVKEFDETRGQSSSSMDLFSNVQDSKGKYNKNKFNQVITPLSKDDTVVEMKLSNNHPIVLKNTDKIMLNYLLAPIVDNE